LGLGGIFESWKCRIGGVFLLKEYSLWFIPSGVVYDKLANVISQLSKKYSTPNFEPHVTLIGNLALFKKSILLRMPQLVDFINTPLNISLTTASYSADFFQSLFVKVEETEELMEASLRARILFNREQDPKYKPHLSLMYGNIAPEIKRAIISEIRGDLKMKFKVNSINLVLSSSSIPPENWHILRRFNLRPSGS
jgi:2'-5' RNA ligase